MYNFYINTYNHKNANVCVGIRYIQKQRANRGRKRQEKSKKEWKKDKKRDR